MNRAGLALNSMSGDAGLYVVVTGSLSRVLKQGSEA